MESRVSRFRLRIESGPRAGEELAVPTDGLVVGRRESSSLCIPDGSVSGEHARVEPDGDALVVHDLGSTNGTTVDGQRVERRAVGVGDRVVFGRVRVLVLDAAAAGGGGDELESIGAEKLAQAGKRGTLGLIVLVVVVVAGGAFAALSLLGGEEEAAAAGATVPTIDGNALADGAFEGDEAGLAWVAEDTAPESFYVGAAFASTGANGLGVDLVEGDWAAARSEDVTVNERRSVRLVASIAGDGSTRARVGVELVRADGGASPLIAWTAPASGGGFDDVELAFDVPPGYDRARVLVVAAGEGSASLDDVGLVPGATGASDDVPFEDFTARVLGDGGSTAVVARGGRVVFGSIGVGEAAPGMPFPWPLARVGVAPAAKGYALTFDGAPAEAVLRLVADVEGVGGGGGDDGGRGWIATLGEGGYRAHDPDFEADGVTSLLLGRGIDLARFQFDSPVRVTGKPGTGGLRLRVGLGAARGFALQLTFREERSQAGALESRAREAERTGDFGAALAAWTQLLDELPFDATLVTEAESARGRLVQDGLSQLDEVRREVERARFFELADLFRQCRASADAVGARFSGSEVERQARTLVAEIDGELARFETGTRDADAERAQAVLSALEGSGAPKLAEHLRSWLNERDQ